MNFDDAIQYLQNAPFTGGSGDRFAIVLSLIAIQAGGATLSLSAELKIPSPPESPGEIQTTVALSTLGKKGTAYLSSRILTVVVPPNYDPGETFDQPFYAGDLGLGTPAMAVTISRPRAARSPIHLYSVPDFPEFSDESNTGLTAVFEVNPLQDFYHGLHQFSITLHDLGAGYAGAGPAIDGSNASAFYVMNLNGVEIPG